MDDKYNLQSHEVIVLKALIDRAQHTVGDLENSLKMDQSAVVRAAMTLKKHRLISVKEEEKIVANLTADGKKVIDHGLPELNLVKELAGMPKKIADVKLGDKNVAIGWAKRKNLIEIDNGVLKVSRAGEKALHDVDKDVVVIKAISCGKDVERKSVENLRSRKFVTADFKIMRTFLITSSGLKVAKSVEARDEVSRLTPQMIKSGKWKDVELRKYNVLAPAKRLPVGRRHFVNKAVDYIKHIWLDLGFSEMEGDIVQSSFWNLDSLFMPQDHPARDMQDTFYVSDPAKCKLDKNIVKKVKAVHENGGDTGSVGWQTPWSLKVAEQNLLRTHTTVLSTQAIAKMKKSDLPAKFFSVGKVFRNESLDWKHLFEFYQVEGIVVDRDANLKYLKGYLSDFFAKMGYTDVRMRPAHFPYTEPSMEIDAWHPVKKQWVEMGGAGIFRPEVTKTLLGEDIPILAWGLGMGRIIQSYYGFNDIRELYKNDVKTLRELKEWLL
ncbi:MAG: phenylalanine--tRNA ligase subunit alpha [Candidatus Aenigmarchaeota archaeon]|nr:phenylalanine--tRNA ligase subunit alpha [Candidatus Aenigmarchaeota archaeon]